MYNGVCTFFACVSFLVCVPIVSPSLHFNESSWVTTNDVKEGRRRKEIEAETEATKL